MLTSERENRLQDSYLKSKPENSWGSLAAVDGRGEVRRWWRA